MVDLPEQDPLAAVKAAADAGDHLAEERLVEVLGEIAGRRIEARLGRGMQVADVEDIAQDVRVKIIQNIGSCRATSKEQLIAWTWAVARNCINDHFRRQGSVRTASPDWLPDGNVGAQDSSESPMSPLMRIMEEIEATLSAEKQRLLYLRLMHGATWEELGVALGITPSAAKRRWQRLQVRIQKRVHKRVRDLPEDDKRAVLEELQDRSRSP